VIVKRFLHKHEVLPPWAALESRAVILFGVDCTRLVEEFSPEFIFFFLLLDIIPQSSTLLYLEDSVILT